MLLNDIIEMSNSNYNQLIHKFKNYISDKKIKILKKIDK
jgi:hypothetical protein